MFNNKSSLLGGLATAIPGEIAGFWEAYKLGGRLPWRDLFQPAIDMCRDGFKVSTPFSNAIVNNWRDISTNDELLKMLTSKETGLPLSVGELVRMPRLAETLERLADRGVDGFYKSALTRMMVEEINSNGLFVLLSLLIKYSI